MQLHDKVQKRSLESGITLGDDKILKDKFTEGVKDEHLRRELRRLQIDCPSMPFTVFHDRAIKWVGPENSVSITIKIKSSVYKTEVEVCSGHDSGVMELLKKQQEHLDKLSSMMEGMKQTRYKRKWKGTNEKGERVCFLCQDPGHMIADCPKNKKNQSSGDTKKGSN